MLQVDTSQEIFILLVVMPLWVIHILLANWWFRFCTPTSAPRLNRPFGAVWAVIAHRFVKTTCMGFLQAVGRFWDYEGFVWHHAWMICVIWHLVFHLFYWILVQLVQACRGALTPIVGQTRLLLFAAAITMDDSGQSHQLCSQRVSIC